MLDKESIISDLLPDFEYFDLLYKTLSQSDLTILASRPSKGKTAFALCLALYATLKQKQSVVYFSLEVSKEHTIQRMATICANVKTDYINKMSSMISENELIKLNEAKNIIKSLPIFVYDNSNLSIFKLKEIVLNLKSEREVDFIIIDYLQLLHLNIDTDPTVNKISDISLALKDLTKEIHIPIVALLQLSGRKENINNLKSIEQYADTVILINREQMHNDIKLNPIIDEKAEIIVNKSHNNSEIKLELIYNCLYNYFKISH